MKGKMVLASLSRMMESFFFCLLDGQGLFDWWARLVENLFCGPWLLWKVESWLPPITEKKNERKMERNGSYFQASFKIHIDVLSRGEVNETTFVKNYILIKIWMFVPYLVVWNDPFIFLKTKFKVVGSVSLKLSVWIRQHPHIRLVLGSQTCFHTLLP